VGDPEYRDHTDHLHIKAKRQTGPLMRVMSSFGHGLVAAFRPGDPDGTKARAAGERGRQTARLTPEQRLSNYARQDGGSARVTPARRRRILKSLRRAGNAKAASAWTGWDRSAGQRRREVGA
jgi:hypothetical protein